LQHFTGILQDFFAVQISPKGLTGREGPKTFL